METKDGVDFEKLIKSLERKFLKMILYQALWKKNQNMFLKKSAFFEISFVFQCKMKIRTDALQIAMFNSNP